MSYLTHGQHEHQTSSSGEIDFGMSVASLNAKTIFCERGMLFFLQLQEQYDNTLTIRGRRISNLLNNKHYTIDRLHDQGGL